MHGEMRDGILVRKKKKKKSEDQEFEHGGRQLYYTT
jgi:hypothetical protein